MGRGFRSTEELCPECGHLLTTKSWDCRFCGWNMDNSKTQAYSVDSWNDYGESDKFSFIDLDVEQLADYA